MQHALTQSLQDMKTDPTLPLHPQQHPYEPQPMPDANGDGHAPEKKNADGKNSRARGDPVNGEGGARRDSAEPPPDAGQPTGTERRLNHPPGPHFDPYPVSGPVFS